MSIQVRKNPLMSELLIEYTQQQIISCIQNITHENKSRMSRSQDLYNRVAKSSNPNEILARISKSDLELVPALHQLIRNPDNKYWHANLLLAISSELFRVSNLWEWLDGEFMELNYDDYASIQDKLHGIYNTELLTSIYNQLNQEWIPKQTQNSQKNTKNKHKIF